MDLSTQNVEAESNAVTASFDGGLSPLHEMNEAVRHLYNGGNEVPFSSEHDFDQPTASKAKLKAISIANINNSTIKKNVLKSVQTGSPIGEASEKWSNNHKQSRHSMPPVGS